MKYKAEIKEIHKLDRKPFGDKNDIYTYQITTTKHTGLLYTSELSVAEGDYIEYDYVQQKNGWKIVLSKQNRKKPMYSNFTKEEKVNYQNTNDSRQQSIEYQSARNVISHLYSGLGHQITLDEIAEQTIYLYNKQQEFFNNK